MTYKYRAASLSIYAFCTVSEMSSKPEVIQLSHGREEAFAEAGAHA
jgi:hypothetical protein